MYECSECGAAVQVIEGKIVRTCECDAPIAANMVAHATGTSTVN
jgi:hypothetical protein